MGGGGLLERGRAYYEPEAIGGGGLIRVLTVLVNQHGELTFSSFLLQIARLQAIMVRGAI